MKSIFLSYSRSDYFFAEMLDLKLREKDFSIWRDQGSIRAGDDWRQTIEEGIKNSIAVVVALSANSAESPYVTYEWAYAVGMGKPVIPIRLSECKIHPRLEPTQYIDFSYPRALPWEELMQRLYEVDSESEVEVSRMSMSSVTADEVERATREVLDYLSSRGFTMASFERLRARIGAHLTDGLLNNLIACQPTIFRSAKIKGGKPGIAKIVP